jgi:hypothetical protein
MSKKKAKKTKDRLLLMPGAAGWDLWRGVPGQDLFLALRTDHEIALEIPSLPAGEITMAFPVRDASSLPFKTPSTDAGLAQDLAEMHIERLGMRPAVMSGVLTDCYEVGRNEAELLLMPVVLRPPNDGSMPKRSPASFDLSARCLPLPVDGVAIWKEFNRWVFVVSRGGLPVFFQALPGEELSEEAGREIRMSLLQLEIQGMLSQPINQGVLWLEDDQPLPSEQALEALARGFGGEILVENKPVPAFSTVSCRLLPADIRAERMASKKRQQLIAIVSVVALAYLGLITWGVMSLRSKEKEAQAAVSEAESLEPQVADLQLHLSKWGELDPITETKHFPVESFYQVSKISPSAGLRIDRAEINNQSEVSDNGTIKLLRRITITGNASDLAKVNQFSEKLHKSRDLAYYAWNTPESTQKKDGRWGFVYTGTPKGAAPN